MTHAPESTRAEAAEPRPSLLPFNPEDMLALRLLPAEFARVVCVSKQSVSRWIAEGKVTLGPDGRLDPAVATRQVIQRTDPARLRARVFKNAMAGRKELLDRIAMLESELAELRCAHAAALVAQQFRLADESGMRLAALLGALEDGFNALHAAYGAGTLADFLDELAGRFFWAEASSTDAELEVCNPAASDLLAASHT